MRCPTQCLQLLPIMHASLEHAFGQGSAGAACFCCIGGVAAAGLSRPCCEVTPAVLWVRSWCADAKCLHLSRQPDCWHGAQPLPASLQAVRRCCAGLSCTPARPEDLHGTQGRQWRPLHGQQRAQVTAASSTACKPGGSQGTACIFPMLASRFMAASRGAIQMRSDPSGRYLGSSEGSLEALPGAAPAQTRVACLEHAHPPRGRQGLPYD